jgi:hypothetical protein
MQETGDGPLFLVFTVFAGMGAHAGFHGQHVLAQAFRLSVLTHQIPCFLTVWHSFLGVFSFYSPISLVFIPVLPVFLG